MTKTEEFELVRELIEDLNNHECKLIKSLIRKTRHIEGFAGQVDDVLIGINILD